MRTIERTGDFIGTTISGMTGRGSIRHNNRSFTAANVDRSRTGQNAVSYTHLDVYKRQLYDWWLHRIGDEIRVGHRFYGIMTLAIYAKKCGISEDELRRDAFSPVSYTHLVVYKRQLLYCSVPYKCRSMLMLRIDLHFFV